jgi:hypothetical protein
VLGVIVALSKPKFDADFLRFVGWKARDAMSGFDSPKEWREVLTEDYGPLKGRLVFHTWVAGATSLALIAIGTLVYGVYGWIVRPVLRSATLTGKWLPQASSWTDIAIAVAITVATVGGATFVLLRYVARMRERMVSSLDEFLKAAVFPRLDAIDERLDKTSKSISVLEMNAGIGAAGALKRLVSENYRVQLELTRLQIQRARYGAEDRYVDVTELLRRSIKDNILEVNVTNETMGTDPFPRKKKTLEVLYSIGRDTQKHTTVASEGTILKIGVPFTP